MKWMIFGSLLVSAVINLIIAVTTEFAIVKWLWLINGVALSVLWPTLIRLLAEKIPKKDLGKSSVVIGTTVATGTLVIYGLSAVYASFDNFKLAFYTAAVAGAAVALVWALLYNKAVDMAWNARTQEDSAEETAKELGQTIQQGAGERKLFFLSVCILCFCAIGVNLIKDGLTTWVPSILKDQYGLGTALSILLTLFLPIVSIFGNMFALKMHQKIPDYISHCALVLAIAGVFIAGILGSMSLPSMVPMLAGLVVVSYLAASLNSLITSIFPMYMRGKVNSGLYAGVLNGFCYLGSTLSAYGLGLIAEVGGWSAVFYCLLGFCGVVCVVWFIYAVCRRIFLKRDTCRI